jgi:hypothetical protein
MRYVLIVMFLFSASVQAEEWEYLYGDFYYSESDSQFNPLERTFSVKMLVDKLGGGSVVTYSEYKCADGKPVKERMLYVLRYEGRMGTGNRTILDADGPWIPFRSIAWQPLLDDGCRVIEDSRKSPPRNPLY